MQSKTIFKAPTKSILKKEPLAHKYTFKINCKRKEIQWDEKGIEEHDLTRGQYQKIDEPKTPYEYANHDDDDEDNEIHQNQKVNINELNKKIMEMQKKLEQGSESDSEDETPEQKLKKKQFANKRKQHYNEIQILKQKKLSLQDQQIDDDEADT